MWRTVLITVVCVAVEFVLGFGLALLLLKSFRGRGFVTVFFLLPMMVVPAVSGFIFLMLFQLSGPVNEALEAIFGLDEPIEWLQNPDLAIWSVMVVDIWQWTPLMFLIFLSGLAALPEDQMNAARILGARFRHELRYLIAADDEADHPDRAHHPRDRGVQDVRPDLPPHPGRARRGDDEHLGLPLRRDAQSTSAGDTRAPSRSSSSSSSASSASGPSGRSSRPRRRRWRSSPAPSGSRRLRRQRVEEAIEAEARV